MLHHPKRAGMGVGWDFPNPGQPPERSCTQGVRSVCLLGPVLGSVGQFWGSFALVRAVGHRWWPIGPYGADPSGAAEPPMPPWVPQIEPDSQAIASCLVQPRITTYFRRGPLRRSQLGYVSMCGDAPIGWGSKVSSVTFEGSANLSRPSFGRDAHPCNTPTCHPNMSELHADVSSGAAEIYAASVALSETLYLSYVASELGIDIPMPLELQVDNAAAIAFSKGQVRRTKLKHIDVRQAWVQALRDDGICTLVKVGTDDNLADFFTKILDVHKFTKLRDRMMRSHKCTGDIVGTSLSQHLRVD